MSSINAIHLGYGHINLCGGEMASVQVQPRSGPLTSMPLPGSGPYGPYLSFLQIISPFGLRLWSVWTMWTDRRSIQSRVHDVWHGCHWCFGSTYTEADFDRFRHDVHSNGHRYVRCPKHRVDVPRSCTGRQDSGVERCLCMLHRAMVGAGSSH